MRRWVQPWEEAWARAKVSEFPPQLVEPTAAVWAYAWAAKWAPVLGQESAAKWAHASAVRWAIELDLRKASGLVVPWGEGWAQIEGAGMAKELGSSLAVMLVFEMAIETDAVWARMLVEV